MQNDSGKFKISDVVIGEGNPEFVQLVKKGIYAGRDFKKGEVVIQYHLKPLTEVEYTSLPEGDRTFTHTHLGQIYLYSVPERYVSHSKNPNTYQDLKKQQDVALRDIKKGEIITGDARTDDVS